MTPHPPESFSAASRATSRATPAALVRKPALACALLAALAAGPAQGADLPWQTASQTGTGSTPGAASAAMDRNAACDPRIHQALIDTAKDAANRQYALITDPDSGIPDPGSVIDLDCLEDVFNVPQINVLVDPDQIHDWLADLLKQTVCDAWNAHIAKTTYQLFDADLFDDTLPHIPGLEISGENVPSGRSGGLKARAAPAKTLATPEAQIDRGDDTSPDLLRTLLGPAPDVKQEGF